MVYDQTPILARHGKTGLGRITLNILLALIALAAGSAPANSPSGGSYVMTKQVVASGGGQASGGGLVLVGTVGQHESTESAQAGSLVVQGGFHAPLSAAAPMPDSLFKNSFEN